MIKRMMLIFLAGMILISAPPARGAGFLIYEHGVVAMSLAGAFTGLANDPSAIWHNPAGLAWVDGTQLLVGATFIFPSGSVTMVNLTGQPTFNQKKQIFYPPNFYLTHKLTDRLAVGIGVFAPFGLGTSWPNENNDFPLRYLAVMADMKTIQVNGVVAYKLSDNVSIGGGVYYVNSHLKQDLVQLVTIPGVTPVSFDVPASLKGKGTSFGWNAGILFKMDKISFGANYRSRFNVDYSGTAVNSLEFVSPPYRPFIPTNGNATLTFKFPDILTFGLAFHISDKVTWTVDYHEYLWKRYDAYTVKIDYPSPFPDAEIIAEPHWKNNPCYRTGLKYQYNDRLTLMGGILFDKTPQPVDDMNPALPDSNRLGVTFGFAQKIGKISLEFAYQYEHFYSRSSDHHFIFGPISPNPARGTYKAMAHLFGLNLGYRF